MLLRTYRCERWTRGTGFAFLMWDLLLEKDQGLGSFLSCLEKGGAERSRDAKGSDMV